MCKILYLFVDGKCVVLCFEVMNLDNILWGTTFQENEKLEGGIWKNTNLNKEQSGVIYEERVKGLGIN